METFYKNGMYYGDSIESAIREMFHDPDTAESLKRIIISANRLKRWNPDDISYEMPWMDAVSVIEDVLFLIKVIGLEGFSYEVN